MDLSWPKQFSVNAGVQKDIYLYTIFSLYYPFVDITDALPKLGPAAHLYKVDISQVCRHLMQVFHWSRPYDSKVSYKSRGVGDKKSQKRAGKYWVGYTSPTGWYTYRQDVVTTPTRCRVGDVYCMASCRNTMTSPKLLKDKL